MRLIRNNTTIITSFQQTLKKVVYISRDIAGFHICYDEFKRLFSNREDKDKIKYKFCNVYFKIFIPRTDPF